MSEEIKNKKIGNVVLVDVSRIDIGRDQNVREATGYSNGLYEILKNQLRVQGQEVPVDLEERADGSLATLRGHRRNTAIKELAEAGVIDPNTVRIDDSGKPIEGTGTPFQFVKAIIHKNVSAQQRAEMVVDQGGIATLNRLELLNACFLLFAIQYGLKQVVTRLAGVFDAHSGKASDKVIAAELRLKHAKALPVEDATRRFKIQEAETGLQDEVFEKHKGTVEHLWRIYQCPLMVHGPAKAHFGKLQSWPTNKDVRELLDAHKLDLKDPLQLGRASKENPGPNFMARWAILKKAVKDAESAGTAVKSMSMMVNSQVQSSLNDSPERFVKAIFKLVLRQLGVDQLMPLNTLLTEALAKLPPEAKAEFDAALDEVYASAQ